MVETLFCVSLNKATFGSIYFLTFQNTAKNLRKRSHSQLVEPNYDVKNRVRKTKTFQVSIGFSYKELMSLSQSKSESKSSRSLRKNQ
jgi:hypothetical protein